MANKSGGKLLNADAIAIVGTACRFPGANNPQQFWDLLSSGRDAVTEIPDERWSKAYYFHPRRGQPGKSYTWAAGVIDDVDRFDAGFFGISPREIRQMDPQQRLLLETVWEALEDAGISSAKLAGTGTGVYVGVSSMDYATLRLGDPASGDAYFMTGMTNSIVANRVSYIFDLRGPSFAVDTACSSSLVALDLGCDALRRGRVPVAIVGGVNLLLAPFSFLGFCQASMLSPTGRCHAFDAGADGYVRAEGAGVVILKPLRDALRNGDPIRALILGTGVNSDGHTMGMSLPSEASQTALLQSVYGKTGIEADRLAFIEAHGTGTQAGDPIELAALGKSLARKRRSPLPIGSVKTNVGHLETASGMAGLIKTLLALEHRELPASLHFKTPNPNIPFSELNLEVAAQNRALPKRPSQLIAGVNSFGFGGTNAHAIVASAPRVAKAAAAASNPLPPLLLSARSANALAALARDWSQRLAAASAKEAAPLLRAAARHRDHHRHRLLVAGSDAAELASALAAAAAGEQPKEATSGLAVPAGQVAFVYAGNGAQFLGMARDALQYSETFRTSLREADAQLMPLLGWSIEQRLGEDNPDYLRHTDIAQPLLFGVQVGITQALRAAGVDAEACIGHSVGEIAAAWAAGALSLQTAGRIVVVRSHQQHRTHGEGGMAALSLDPETAAAELAKIGGGLEIAAINSRSNVTVAGGGAALRRLEAAARSKGWHYTPLDIEYAFHSPILDRIREDLLADLGDIEALDCGKRFTSSVTGKQIAGTALVADYWWQNIRWPVRFRDAVDDLVHGGTRIFIEIGPNPILQSYLRDGLRAADAGGRVLGTLSRTQADSDPFARIAAQCYVAGYDLAAHADFAGPVDIAGLPRYPWQRERHWYQATTEAIPLPAPPYDHPLLGFRFSGERNEWTQLLDLEREPWLADHAVEGLAVLPAAATLEIGLAVARAAQPEAGTLALDELEIRQALTLEADHAQSLRVRLDTERAITITGRPRLTDEPHVLHALARIAPPTTARPPALVPAPSGERIDAATVYARARALGLDYGPQFRVISHVDILSADAAHAWFDPAATGAMTGFLLPPPLLDGGLQAFLALLGVDVEGQPGLSLLPWRFTGVKLFGPFGRTPIQARLRVTGRGTRSARGAIVFFDASGDAVAEIAECWFRRVRLSLRQTDAERTFRFGLAAMPGPGQDAAPPFETSALIGALNLDPPPPSETALLLEGFVVAASHKALRQSLPAAIPFRIEDLIGRGTIAAEAAPLLASLLHRLAAHHAASEVTGQGWRLADGPDLPDSLLIWRTILAEEPVLTAELALAAAAAEALPDFLVGGTASACVLPPSLVEQFYYASPSGSRVADVLRRAALNLAMHWPEGRPLRILEIGAGSGILSRRILDGLAPWHGTLRYVATEADADQAGRLAARLQGIGAASTLVWDPRSADVALGQRFDVVLSAYALTRQTLDGTALRILRQLLAPGGLILAAEPEPSALWDWIFGQQPQWWQEGFAAEAGASPLRPAAAWSELLLHSGFTDATTATLAADPWPVGLVVARRDADIEAAVAPSSGVVAIIVAEHDDARAALLAQDLIAAGGIAEVIVPPEIGDGNLFCAVLSRLDTEMPEIVVLPPRAVEGVDRVAATNASLVRIITIAQLTTATRARARLWIVTDDAQQAPTTPGSREDAALWGLGRTVANEMPQLNCCLVDLSSRLSAPAAARALAAEMLAVDGEREIVITPTGRHVLRLRRGLAASTHIGPVRLTVNTPGRIDSLQWQASPVRSPGTGEVAIAVRTADLNFRDVMWALDLLPEEALIGGHAGPTLGLACAGIVTGVGPDVVEFASGDRVLAIAPATLATEVVTTAHTVTRLPEGLDFAAAATLPVAFITVIYALGHLAQVRPGERVLIHGGAGAVGIAAIQFAKHCGAEVIATSGSPTKRAFLRQFGADHVLDSRDLAFVDAINNLTGHEGVDVVLNSLSGDAMERSLTLVRPFGRFLELGKRDFFLGTRIGLKPLRRNVSYFAIDVDTLAVERPDLSAALMRQTIELVGSGALRPLPYRRFARAEVGDAFRLMQASGHIGKIVIDMADSNDPAPTRPTVEPSVAVRSDGTYLVAGGLSGFGLASAEWLARQGARSLALLGRRGAATPGATEALARLRDAGVDARAYACDVADRDALSATLTSIRRDMAPLKGVIHAAMQLDDALLGDLDGARVTRVLAPKLGGAVNLDQLTRPDPIELFLLYSSATTVFGAPGQGSYVAANAALEGVARRRRAEGLPALVVGWGPIGDAGYLARNEETREALARRLAANPLPAAEALDALPALWASGEVAVAYASVRWDAAQRMLPSLTSATFAEVVSARLDNADGDLREKLGSLGDEERKELILSVLVEEVTRILSTAAGGLDPHRSVAELGMDSLMAVELRLALEGRFGVNLPMLSLSQQTSLAMIAANLARGLATTADTTPEIATAAQRYESADPDALRQSPKQIEIGNIGTITTP
jgi:phthiocerol/phenolphthiocerol synthesis type-I polyketide synthase C